MEAIVHVLLPIADIITPNIEEAKVLCELSGKGERIPEITRWQDLATLARLLLGSSEGPRWVLVKGGHLPFAKDGTVATKEEDRHLVVNALVSHEIEKPIFITTQFVDSKDTHGTGCSLACRFNLTSNARWLCHQLTKDHARSARTCSRNRIQPLDWAV